MELVQEIFSVLLCVDQVSSMELVQEIFSVLLCVDQVSSMELVQEIFSVLLCVDQVSSMELVQEIFSGLLCVGQVSSMELVQEIFQVLIDKEETCERTCFSLQLDGVTMDNFAELKTIEGLKENSVVRVVKGEAAVVTGHKAQNFCLRLSIFRSGWQL